MTSLDGPIVVMAGVFGTMLGSFLNVVIHRLPERKSIVRPGSSCPGCGTPIRWYDNIPVLSWVLLRGKCRNCKAPISPRYLLVEVLTGVLVAFPAWLYLTGYDRRYGMFLASVLLVLALVPVTFIDLKLRIIPDRITKPGMVIAPIVSMAVPELHQLSLLSGISNLRVAALVLSLAGMAAGAGAIWLMGVVGKLAFKKEAMGFGDVKLMGMVGGFLGPVGVLLAILIGCVVGALVGVVSYVVTRSSYIPFGPFLSAGALAVLFFRPEVVHFLTVTYPALFRG
jgi:leader peptidase (prepilin peptidase)/N-methyltransferase